MTTETKTVDKLTRSEIEEELNRLIRAFYENPTPHPGYGNVNSVRSPHAIYSKSVVDCYLCTYCETCENCVKCTHCKECRDVFDSRYCQKSKRLSGCSYVLLSSDCHDCIFCFACTGLVRQEFHILNRSYDRKTYFELLPRLKSRFGIR